MNKGLALSDLQLDQKEALTTQVFSCKICNIFEGHCWRTYFEEHLLTTASEQLILYKEISANKSLISDSEFGEQRQYQRFQLANSDSPNASSSIGTKISEDI